ncbi:hypothetical protein [Shimia sp. SDUM112013]|uniref:hypothetical protein n=1 Tax=Shimia sp. SDUM112013 TaxID=3136160 RepID=UPI0032F09168
MIRGLYRTDENWVIVLFENGELPVSEQQYRDAAYDPPLKALPTQKEYLDTSPKA